MRGAVLAVVALGLAGAGVTPIPAQTSGDPAPVRVYTNADLEGLAPISTSPPSPAGEGPGWEFVIDFLAEQHARIDAQRAYELDRALVEGTVRESSRPRYTLPLNYWPWLDPVRVRRGACRPQSLSATPGVPRAWIVPLHARPASPGARPRSLPPR